MKGYTVFNVEQIEGLPEHFYVKPEIQTTPVERIAHAEALFFAATKADIRYRGTQAFYSIDGDYIQMPVIEAFRDPESFYATLANESAHWTRHPSRLDRSFGRKRFGDEGYAQEELVAELASAFLSADLGITPEPREDHAAYIASWLTVLKNDKRAIFTAASFAQKTVDYLHNLINCRVIFLNLAYLRPHRSRIDEVLPDQHPADNQADDDKHDAQLDQRESA